MPRGLSALLALVASSCGGSSAPTQVAPSGPPASLVAMPSGAADVVVATVNGRPVYASCLQAQGARGASKQVALEQCIDFELLAQLSISHATDAEVVDATRTELVSELIAREFETKFTKPTDFGAYWDRIVDKNRQRISHGEARASAYVRIPVAKTATPEEDAAAKKLAEEFAAAAATERGLMQQHLSELAQRVIGTRAKYDFAVIPPYLDNGGLVPEYAKPLFAIPEVGRTTPQTVRTPWGWDVILLTDLVPAKTLTGDELITDVLPDVKRSYFPLWAAQIAQHLGITPQIYTDKLPLLEEP